MKNSFLLLFLSIFIFGRSQQKSEILPLVENMITYTHAGDYNKVLDQTYPKLFEMVPKEQMLEILRSSLKNEDFEIGFNKIDPDIRVFDVKEINGGKYAEVKYINSLSLKFFNEEMVDPAGMKGVLEASFPGSKVSWNDNHKSFNIVFDARMMAISNQLTGGTWKFLNSSKNDVELVKLLLDEEVINTFGL